MTAVDAAKLKNVTTQAIHKELKAKSLESYKSNNRVYFKHDTSKKIFNHSFEKSIISFQIVKGGTGKTTITHAFAIRANLYGAKVLCIDLDQQGNLTQAFGVNCDNSPVMVDIIDDTTLMDRAIVNITSGLDILPSRIENAVLDNHLMLNKHPLDRVYKNIINTVIENYDLIVIDCPPALGQSVTAATLASDTIIFPLTPEKFSLSGLEISYKEISTINKRFNTSCNFKILLNKFDMRTALSSEVLAKIMNHALFQKMTFNTFIRSCQDFPNMLYATTNIFSNTKYSAAKDDIDLLTKEILNLNIKK